MPVELLVPDFRQYLNEAIDSAFKELATLPLTIDVANSRMIQGEQRPTLITKISICQQLLHQKDLWETSSLSPECLSFTEVTQLLDLKFLSDKKSRLTKIYLFKSSLFYVLPPPHPPEEQINKVTDCYWKKHTRPSARPSIPRHIRIAVWNRDNARCVECLATEQLEFDHIIPVAKGGATSLNNLQLLCLKCNRAKSSKI